MKVDESKSYKILYKMSLMLIIYFMLLLLLPKYNGICKLSLWKVIKHYIHPKIYANTNKLQKVHEKMHIKKKAMHKIQNVLHQNKLILTEICLNRI